MQVRKYLALKIKNEPAMRVGSWDGAEVAIRTSAITLNIDLWFIDFSGGWETMSWIHSVDGLKNGILVNNGLEKNHLDGKRPSVWFKKRVPMSISSNHPEFTWMWSWNLHY